ncbi:hypothetical protein ACET3X_006418 [Alternaria dauci]|uniref:Myb-like domain-containing protein n=1 Tax=Alternaria dauci TaxID=48095 RepID=A0ABR3UDM2_9PLEO
MEPPRKRMRILQPVEVDEDNVEYIKAKQQQEQKLKSRFESIFEKFGNMHESQSDEIDFTTNRVVVDRGHLRRIKRRFNGKEKGLVDTMLMSSMDNLGYSEDEEAGEGDSEDELALPQLAKSKTTVPPEQDMSKRQVELTPTNAHQYPSSPLGVLARIAPHIGTPQIPNAPNPLANLPYLQFPQTPAQHEDQKAFYTNLAQALAPFITAQNTPNTPLAIANAAPAPVTPTITSDKVAPATDPKWYFPALPAEPRPCPVAQSSPLPSHTRALTEKEADEQHTDTIPIDVGEERPAMTLYTRPDGSSPTKPRRSSPRVEIQRRGPRSLRRYHFTREDDVYISRRKAIEGAPWAAIKEGREKWKEWPTSALHNRWAAIKHQNLHLQDASVASTDDRVNRRECISTKEVAPVSKLPHHLPTPSSSEHEEYHQNLVDSTQESVQHTLSSITHYDDDDLDLLSLAGSDPDDDHLPTCDDDDDTITVASQDVILPSIETGELVDGEDTTLEEDLPSTPQTQDFVMTPTRASVDLLTQDTVITPTRASSVTVKTEPLSSPTTLVKRKRSPPLAETLSNPQDTQDDSDDWIIVSHEPANPVTTSPHHVSTQQNTHIALVSSRDTSLDLITGDDDVDEDELNTFLANPTTPSSLKRKRDTIATPVLPRTPNPGDVDGSSDPRTTKSTAKANRKSFLKQVKREWTRKGTPVKESAIASSANRRKRRRLSGAIVGSSGARKRKWVDEGSEDELTMF